MRLLPLALVLTGLLALPAADAVAKAPAAKVPFGFFGVDVDGLMFDPAISVPHEFTRMNQAGVESALTEINWAIMQPTPDGPIDYARTDRTVLAGAARGIRILGDVVFTPPWAATDPGAGQVSPPDPAAYARFTKLLVQRYGPKGTLWTQNPGVRKLPIRQWQVWNEPSLPNFWSQQPFEKAYIKVLRQAHAAIKAADPKAQVILASLVFRSWEDLTLLYRAGAKGLFDAVSLHPYSMQIANVRKIIFYNRQVLQFFHQPKLPILVTETSWPSAKGKSTDNFGYEVTEQGEATKLAAAFKMFAASRKALGIAGVYWSTWLSSDESQYTFQYSGLNKFRDGKAVAKPALAAYRTTTLKLEGCKRKGKTARRCG